MADDLTLIELRQVVPSGPRLRFKLDGHADRAAGQGGWEVIPRPRRRALTEWSGVEPYTLTLPLIKDRLDVAPTVNESVEQELLALERMALKVPNGVQPPVVTVFGPVPMVPTGDGQPARWVIQDIVYGQAVRRSNGDRVQQHLELTLLQYVRADVTLSPSKRARDRHRKQGKKQSDRTYVVKAGDTLSGIAARKLGDASKWRSIADLNDIRDPRRLRVGVKLRIPG